MKHTTRSSPLNVKSKKAVDLLRVLSSVHSSPRLGDDFALDVRTYRSLLKTMPAEGWERAGEAKALRLFRAMAERVPAYKDFLKKHKVRPESIKTIKDFTQIPQTTKENYIKKYSAAQRSWDGTLAGHTILALSSGTSGEPTMWPRGAAHEREALLIHELLLTDLYKVDTYRTLMVIGFPMGMYVSGVATTIPSLLAAFKHPNLTIATIGYNKESALELVKTVGVDYEQVLLVGHPFYVKDLIETGSSRGIEWEKLNVRTMMCSEGFNELWREYVAGTAGIKDASTSVFNTYGSSEFLLVGLETPLSIRIRAAAEKVSGLSASVFGTNLTPNLFQYNPLMRYLEVDPTGDLLVTADTGIPLVRFNQHDAGGIISQKEMYTRLGDNAKDVLKKGEPAWNLPFVTLYDRSDRTLVFYAANIYPEHISAALNSSNLLSKLTGRFEMEKKPLINMDQYMEIHIEMREEVLPEEIVVPTLQQHIVKTLEQVNREYLFLRGNLKKDMLPKITLHPHGSAPHFDRAGKPRFIVPAVASNYQVAVKK